MNNLEDIKVESIREFLRTGTAFDGYLYAMGILMDEFVKNGMDKFDFAPFELGKVDIFQLTAFDLSRILISCVMKSTLSNKEIFIANTFSSFGGSMVN